ncbi:MAG: carboxypeptidase regulatory-like domain-containing protein [Ignavibacteria bacterium]|nr:carboxypeptidase regulatory-like domain-containing protein [Ignavibacteria bacterium]
MKHRIPFLLGILFSLGGLLFPQNVILQPPAATNNKVKLFYSKDSTIYLNWSPAIAGSRYFIYGKTTGNYTLPSIQMVNDSYGSFIPANNGISTGRYYAMVTNSADRTLSAIQAGSGNKYSNEIQFIVESPTAPTAQAPKGSITTATPTFQWTSVPGVPAYWIIVSSTPFVVRTNSHGDPEVQGANIVWDYLTTDVSAVYGQISPYSPFTQTAIPLFPGNTYYYTILNLYDSKDVSYASSVFGGVVAFKYESQQTIAIPNLIAPATNSTFQVTPTIRFQWDQVANANSYSLYLFNRVTTFAGSNQEIDIPIWNTTTTNTQIDFPAQQFLLKGKYAWFVVPNTVTGAGVASETRVFNYQVTMSKFKFELRTTFDQSNLINYNVYIASTTGGYSPSVPFIASNSQTVTDSLPSDIYRCTVTKQGYYDSTFTFAINSTSSYPVNFVLWAKPYPAAVSGKMVDQAGAALGGGLAQFVNVVTNDNYSVVAGATGEFSTNLPQGTYRATVSKPGYLSPAVQTVTVPLGQLLISTPFVLTLDKVIYSGKTVNDAGSPVQLASVKATKGAVVQEATSNESGSYSFELSSGQWIIEAAKNGFISPQPLVQNLVTGTNIQNQALILIPRANQVSGTIYKGVVTESNINYVPVSGVTVTATPATGVPVTAVTGAGGQYQLSLKGGSYIISASLQGYTANVSPQLTVGVAQTISGIDINLAPNPCSVTGTVTDPSGSTLGDVVVSNGSVTSSTLPTGNYTLSLPAGTHNITVTKSSYVSPQPLTVSLTPGQALSGINFTMNPNAGVISGSVSSLGQPLANATVTVRQGTAQPYTVLTNNLGSYQASVQPGTWKVFASKSGFINSDTVSFYVGAGQSSAGHDLSLTENIATIKGVVSTPLGQPLNGVEILVREKNNTSVTYTSSTDINGEYALSIPAGITYTRIASLTGYTTHTVDIASSVLAPKSVRIENATLSPVPASISGKVADNQSQNVSGAKIYLINNTSGAYLDSTTTTATGSYTLGTYAGTFKIKAVLPGYTTDSTIVTISLGQTVNSVNLKINPNYALLFGSITSGSTPVVSALLTLTGSYMNASATSASDGKYQVLQLIGDTYKIKVTCQGFGDTTYTVTIKDGESKNFAINMSSLNGSISGTVMTDNSSILTDATVVATAVSTGQSYSAISGTGGIYTLKNLPKDSYTVSASKNGYTTPAGVNVIINSSNLSVTANISGLKLKNSVISGTVTDLSVPPVSLAAADVTVSGTAGSGNTVTNLTGYFEITGLADGTYQLKIQKQGYVARNETIVLSGTNNATYALSAANTTVSGKVVNQKNVAITTPITVQIVGAGVTQSTTTDGQGTFTFKNLSSNAQYTITTQIFQEGYANDDSTFTIASGVPSVTGIVLNVKVSKSVIYGTTGVGGATVTIQNKSTLETFTVSSSSNGRFSYNTLPDGMYSVTPNKSGFTFLPVSVDRTLDVSAVSDSLIFAATENVGAISITCKDNTNAVLSGVTVTAVSRDNNYQYSAVSDNSGAALFQTVASGRDYSVRSLLSGYTTLAPDSLVLTVSNKQTASGNFTLRKNTSKVAGTIRSKATSSGIPNVTVNYKNNASGQSMSVVANGYGDYSFDALPAGNGTISVSKDGYKSTPQTFDLALGETKTVNMDLTPAFINLTGKVVYQGKGVAGVSVKATSSNVYTATTDTTGFVFTNLPASPGPDTTVYKVQISGTDIPNQLLSVVVTPNKVGGSIDTIRFELPAAQLAVTVNDGTGKGIEGVSVTVVKPDGSASVLVTDKTGGISTLTRLIAGKYSLDFAKDEYLEPDTNITLVRLQKDEVRNYPVSIRYRYTPITSMSASDTTLFKVTQTQSLSNVTGTLYYKQGNAASYQTYPFDNSLVCKLPPLNKTDNVMYYITIREVNAGITYTSATYSLKPEAKGILSSVTYDPAISNLTLRKEDVYATALKIYDGKNNVLNTNFVGSAAAGTVSWEVSDQSVITITKPNASDPTAIQFVVSKTAPEGKYSITAVVTYKGTIIRQPAEFSVKASVLKSISVSSTENEVSNRSTGVKFSYTGLDTSATAITLGQTLAWKVLPEKVAGTIDSTGYYTPPDSLFFGTVTIIATDKITGKQGSKDIDVYAEVSPASSLTLTDRQGMFLTLPANSVPFTIKLHLDKQQFGPGKKYYVPTDNSPSYIVGYKQYPISYTSDQAIPKDSLLHTGTLILPMDNSLSLYETAKAVGYYDADNNQWSFRDSTQLVNGSYQTTMNKFGEYALMAQNEPLGITNLAVLPTPFSPKVADLKIGFQLTTQQRNASVSIQVYNMRGELVRRIWQDEQVGPGVYGTSRDGSEKKSILWNGRTEAGNEALNGRYIIQVTAKDPSGTVSKLIPVVLVK